MKKLLLGISVLLLSGLLSPAKATHIVGGELYYECMGNGFTEVYLKMYRDCGPSNNLGTGFDPTAVVGVYDSTGNLIRTLNLFFPGASNLPVVIDNPCFVAPPNVCVEEAVYSSVISLPPRPGGYDLVYQRCCRNPTIQNIVNPSATGASFVAHIPDTALVNCNNAAHFKQFPPLAICKSDSIKFDHSAIDSDGDSLVYSLCSPTHGGSQTDPAPNPPSPPPHSSVNWKAGYSGTYPIDANPAFQIDPHTGLLTGTATQVGQYVVGVCVSEYRNGQLINVNRRDFQFNVTNCPIQSVSAIAKQQVYCDGRTVEFTNKSQNAGDFFWNFGDPNSNQDTSTANSPIYTYSDTGTYTVMLIANPGRFCADTAYRTFEVKPPLYPEFEPPAPQCFEGNNFSFQAAGEYGPNPVFQWDFGSSATPSVSPAENPSGVSFSSPGFYPVKLTIWEFGCERSFIDTVKVYPHPEPSFYLKEDTGCVPFEVKFYNASDAWTAMTYKWKFGNGATSTAENPSVTFLEPGSYDVSLTVSSTEGCVDTRSLTRENVVTVNPLPHAAFEADPMETNMYEPEISFYDRASGHVSCWWFVGDSLISQNCPSSFTHSFRDTGNVLVRQVAVNEYQCTDTAVGLVRISPVYNFYIPNTFTPDGDGLNDVFKPEVFAQSHYEFYVFDRWGELIFQTTDPEAGWDGTANGGTELSPTGTYVYKVVTKDQKGKPHTYTGAFHLLK